MMKEELNGPQEFCELLKCHPVTARLLWNRGFRTKESVDEFLHPELQKLPNPLSIADMENAVLCTADAIESEQQITIYADYDVDGTCGATLLYDFFKNIGIQERVHVYQPDRFKEGYGIHVSAIEKCLHEGADLIISVDCGITAHEPARVVKEHGKDLIIIDHHKCGETLPDAFAVIDPLRPDDTSALNTLCGTGLAFFFVMALRAELRSRGFFEERAEPNLKALLDLVAVATIADMMDVRGVNRILISHGLTVLEKKPRPGFSAILRLNSIKKPTAMDCGFIIGPRINAAGRLQHARAAFELLSSEHENEAIAFATRIEELNRERRSTQEDVVREALEQAEHVINDPRWDELASQYPAAMLAKNTGLWPRALVLYSEEWHEGVVGIVASKVMEVHGRPIVVLTKKEGAQTPTLKGSMRSLGKVDIYQAVAAESVAKLTLNFGGHAFAGGVTLLEDQLKDFISALNVQLAMTTTPADYKKERHVDAEVKLNEIDTNLASELEMLGPFGMGFPEPVFKIKDASTLSFNVLKEKHLKLKMKPQVSGLKTSVPDVVWFNVPQKESLLEHLSKGQPIDLWVNTQWNEWMGSRSLQLRVSHAEWTTEK